MYAVEKGNGRPSARTREPGASVPPTVPDSVTGEPNRTTAGAAASVTDGGTFGVVNVRIAPFVRPLIELATTR